MENPSFHAEDHLIDLGVENSVENVSEFDPFAPANAVSAPVQRRPSRPPPPPPNVPPRRTKPTVDPRVQGLTPELVSLDVNSSPRKIKNESNNTQNTLHRSVDFNHRPKSSSFMSYINSGTEQAVDVETNYNNINTSSTNPPVVHEIGNSKFLDFEGATGRNEMTTKLLSDRDKLMQLFMAKRQDDYTSTSPYKVFVGTWNVNGQLPNEPLNPWVASEIDPPDVYVIGFQELDLSKEAFVFSESSREEEWLRALKKSLHPKAVYKLVKHIRLVGMMLLVFAQERHLQDITAVVSHHVGTGLLGKMGNKGGVGVRMKLHSSTFCFVNSHLAAHLEEIQRRNQDYNDICSRMRFPDPDGQSPFSVFTHDVLIWLGDLNYRIDKLSLEEVKDRIEFERYEKLREHDQLTVQMREGNVYMGFKEGDLTFRPTYKYNPGTNDWDNSEKCRCPAWCDRILWRESGFNKMHTNTQTKKKSSVHQLKYQSHPTLKISDHKPVSSLFNVDVKVINQALYRKVYEEEIRRLDRMENEWLPTMTLSQHTLEFGTVKFQQAVIRSVEIENTGQTPCHFEFIGKLGETQFCKPWLTISKPKGYVLPGDKQDIEFEIYVNKTTSPSLNNREDRIEDILILHLVGGKDFFVTVNGNYSPSCFGMSIEALCRMRMPVQQMDQTELTKLCKINPWDNRMDDSSVLNVPKELWRILDHLYHNARYQPDLFQQPGLHEEMKLIQENLDTQLPTVGNPLPGSNHSVAEALLIFLEALPEPVIPFNFYPACMEVYNDFERCRALLRSIPVHHLNVFNYLISFLQELPKHEANGLDFHLIATIFSGLILRPSSTQRKQLGEARMDKIKSTAIIEAFLNHKVTE